MVSKGRFEELRRELCQILLRIGAVRFGIFTLASGKLSPYYIDLRLVPSYPSAFDKITQIYLEQVKALGLKRFKRIGAIPTAGIAFAAPLAYELEIPLLYVRKDAKEHGRERLIEGIVVSGDRILIVDDILTSGKTITTAAEAIRAEGGVVSEALVLIDREEGGKEALAKAKIKLHTFMSVREVARTLYNIDQLTKEQYDTIIKQIKG